MKTKTCCFTGHRNVSSMSLPELERKLDETIAMLVSQGTIYFGSGGAIGFDQIAARAVLRQREHNPTVKLIMVLPCRDQDSRWSMADREEFKRLLAAADKVSYVSDQPYFDGCMQARNRHLVDNSGVCVAYLTRARSGTGQTVRMAKERGLRVINLAG